MSTPSDPAPPFPRFPWRTAWDRTTTAVFVIGADRRLRYANPAWGQLTGRAPETARGMRISARRSAGHLAQTLAPPPEVWQGQASSVRRAPADASIGPPWWDITYTPFPNDNGKPMVILATVTVVGRDLPKLRSGSPRLVLAVAELRRHQQTRYSWDVLASSTLDMKHLLVQARFAARTRAPVWITGEPGSGKETVARVIHANSSRKDRGFARMDCQLLQPYVIEGMLFGKGGLIESPHLGTLYLHEPSELPRDLQERVAAIRKVRIICGSSRPPGKDVRSGRLLAAYPSELSVIEIQVPPLRDRQDDLRRIVAVWQERDPQLRVADDAWPALQSYHWPGNLRELGEVLQDAMRHAQESPITRGHLPRLIQERQLIADHPPSPARHHWTLDEILEATERRLIQLALRKAQGSLTAAAHALGMPRPRLARRLEALGIAPPEVP